MSKSKDGESIITQLESITNQDQSLWMAEKQPSTDVNKGDETNMSVRSKTKSKQSGVSSISTARKAAILSKKFEAEKAALRLKLLEEESVQCQEEENELQILQQKQRLQEEEQKRLQADLEKAKVQAERRKKWRELQQQARESQLEYEHAVNEEECMREEENRSMRQGLVELLGSETLEDRVMRLGQDETRNDNQDNLLSGPEQPLDRQNTTHTIPGTNGDNQVHSVRARDIQGTINETVYNPERANRFRAENTIPNLSQPKIQKETAPTESLLEKMLPTLIKMERPKLPVFDGNPVDYARFKACVKVEIERKGVYDNVEKLKFLLDAVTGSAKSCLKRFIPGSERYKEAWQALDNRFGQPDVVVAAAKKQIDEFPDIPTENAEKIREYQELVSELVGVYKELDFAHELKAQLPESYVKRLPTRLCARWGEKVEGKPELSTWEEFAIWLEKEAKLCEGKQRWMPEKRERRKSSWQSGSYKDTRGDRYKSGVFAGAMHESSNRNRPRTVAKCPIHESGKHTLQECRKFTNMSVDEKEKLMLANRLCLSCLTPGHRLSQCEVKVKCRVESCGMRHHTLVHEVDKRFIERAKAKKQEHGTAKSPPPPSPPPTNEQNVGFYGKTGYYGKGQALVEVEGILNSRPITQVSSDASDWEALTPNHLILLRANPAVADVHVEDKEINSRKVWRQSQALANFFWKRFITEYIPSQTRRKKWTEKARSMKVGDLVLVADSNQSRGMWPMGRITVVYPGADKVVRVVMVKTPQGEYKRSVTRLCLLEEVDSDDGCLGGSSTGGGDVPASGD